MHRVIDMTADGRVRRAGTSIADRTASDLAQALRGRIEGEVRFSDGDRALYATDASNYRQTPVGVVAPRTRADVVTTIALCREFGVPIVSRGGGTALAGQTCNTAVVIDFSKYLNRILAFDPAGRTATVEPGCVLDHLRAAAETHGLTFGPDPATHDHNTLGGMIGNDSCGEHSIMSGRTADNVSSLDILTYDGLEMTVGPTPPTELEAIKRQGGRRAQIYSALEAFWIAHGSCFEKVYPQIPRRVSGYENLDQLSPGKGFNLARALVGSEGTLVTVLSATLDLIPSPPARALAILGYPDVYLAADAVPQVLQYSPIAVEGFDQTLVDYMRLKHLHEADLKVLPEGHGWLICEFGDEDAEAACAKAQRMVERLSGTGVDGRVVRDRAQQRRIWRVREAGLPASSHIPGKRETHAGWEDAAVRREDLGRYLRDFEALMRRFGYQAAIYGHFGDGLIHCRIDFDLTSAEGLQTWTRFLGEAADLVVRYGGSLSGEHGDGQARGALLEKMYGPELMAAQRAFKAIWDPDGQMNPGKIVEPYPITSNLRQGPDYRPLEVAGTFAYPDDAGSFTQAMTRCVGVGTCRRTDSDAGVMCPSYMATLEERYSTRGRARLLFEMLSGETLTDGFANEAVEEALDFCLSCKGCKSDCPMQVDMAQYKAEFRYRHFQGRLRPRAAYAMGQIHRWARVARLAPWAANGLTRTPGLRSLVKAAAGIAQPRQLPTFAGQSLQAWAKHRRPSGAPAGGDRIVLWPDTFTNHFRPGSGINAVRVLEHLGYEAQIPQGPLCCGRPLYDWGWLDEAKALWRHTLEVLRPQIEAGVPVVGLEPACVSAFRDELPALFPSDPLAHRLAEQTVLLTEFIARSGRPPPWVGGEAVVQIHCHHHALLDVSAELQVLGEAGIRARSLASGCCGMAGSFGFEAPKYAMSMAAAERVLLPEIRAAAPGTLILANGFSCREQIEQATGRVTLNAADALAAGLTSASAVSGERNSGANRRTTSNLAGWSSGQ